MTYDIANKNKTVMTCYVIFITHCIEVVIVIPFKKSANNVVEVLLPSQIVNSILIGQYLFDTSLISEKSRSLQKKYEPSSLGASNEPCNSNCQRVVKSLYFNAVFCCILSFRMIVKPSRLSKSFFSNYNSVITRTELYRKIKYTKLCEFFKFSSIYSFTFWVLYINA